jgi:hypothetical protein
LNHLERPLELVKEFKAAIAFGINERLSLAFLYLGARKRTLEGRSWNSSCSGWVVSAETAQALRSRVLSLMSERDGTGRPMILEAEFAIFISLFLSVTDRRW